MLSVTICVAMRAVITLSTVMPSGIMQRIILLMLRIIAEFQYPEHCNAELSSVTLNIVMLS